jgi:hypothetical protein
MKQIVLAKCFLGAAASLLLVIPFVNCGNSPETVGGTGAGQGTGNNSGGGGTSTSTSSSINLPDASSGTGNSGGGGTGDEPSPDANCGVQTSKTTKLPADVLLVLDRSGSMNESIADDCCCGNTCTQATGKKLCTDRTNCSERWPALTSGVTTTISQTKEINWGLKLFASKQSGGKGGSSCGVSDGVEVNIAPAATSAAAIQTQIASADPSSATPTAQALAAATTYLKGVKDANAKVILLATDGEPNCGPGGDSNSENLEGTKQAAQTALTAGYKVYVIGIGPSLDKLNAIADAGGTAKQYPATSPDELAKALTAITTAIASCTFTMDTAPPEPDNIAVWVGQSRIDKDPANGWSYGGDSKTIVFNGSACDRIKTGSAGQVQVMFGCGSSPPPPLY